MDVHRKFKLRSETLYVCQFVLDKFMSKVKLANKKLHLLGVATLLIATKYEEIYPPTLGDFISISENKFTKPQIVAMEKEILDALDYNITAPSHYRFLERFSQLTPCVDEEVFSYAQFILEISLLEASFLRFKPSYLAAAALILSVRQLKKEECWTKEVETFTCYSAENLAEAVSEVQLFCEEINPKFISILKYKFSKAEHHKVSNYKFKF